MMALVGVKVLTEVSLNKLKCSVGLYVRRIGNVILRERSDRRIYKFILREFLPSLKGGIRMKINKEQNICF
jgi:glycerol-3-phosphate O-acyltransferase